MSNPFQKLNEIKDMVKTHSQDKDLDDMISRKDHYKEMYNLITLIEKELADARYQFVFGTLYGEEFSMENDITMTKKELDEDLTVFQPYLEADNYNSEEIADALTKYVQQGTIDKNILLLPPEVSILRAKLADS